MPSSMLKFCQKLYLGPKRVPLHDADDLANQAMLANLDKECGTITRWELFVVAFTIIISDRDLLGRLD